jgi:alpha-maltose-1-phosphate synthase
MVDRGVTGLLVQPGDERALAEAIDTLHADRRLAERMGRAGRRKAASVFSLERHAERVAVLYDSLLAAKESRRRRT